MNKIFYVLIILILIVSAIVSIISIRNNPIAGQVVADKYSFTKAICNESNFCQDYIISCDSNKILEIKSITGAAVQQSLSWKDNRSNEEKNKLCD